MYKDGFVVLYADYAPWSQELVYNNWRGFYRPLNGHHMTPVIQSQRKRYNRLLHSYKWYFYHTNFQLHRDLSMELTARIFNCFILTTLTSRCEGRTLRFEVETNIRTVEMWFLTRILRISYLERVVTNEDLLRRAEVRNGVLLSRKDSFECWFYFIGVSTLFILE